MNEYDIAKAFEAIEKELMSSMLRNMERHKAEETKEGIEWSQWQAEQLKALEQYKIRNREKYGTQFKDINKEIAAIISAARTSGGMEQEMEILRAIKRGFTRCKKTKDAMTAQFFRMNDRKIEALIRATVHDMEKAETAILRMANDKYRQIIFNAQVYANTGAGTYEKAVDMAAKDMLSSGLGCVEYANGARHTLKEYAGMAIRTASKRAYLTGEGEKRKEWGISTVIINKRGNPCPLCLPWVGKVMIDDVWSGGKKSDGPYPLMSTAVSSGLYHPRCRDSHTTYFEGISEIETSYTKEELKKIESDFQNEQKQQYVKRQVEKFDRLARYSLDTENKSRYEVKAELWKNVRFRTGNLNSKKYAESKRILANFYAMPQNKVVEVLRQESKVWIGNLTENEISAIQKYTYNLGDEKPNRFFERLNAMLRGDLPKDNKLSSYAEIISGALKKNRIQHDVICYRNVRVNPIEKSKPGSILKLNQFISTSVISSRALNNNCKMIIYVPKGTKGAYIEEISKFPKQRELLLDKDCVYRVLLNKKNEIELEVLP